MTTAEPLVSIGLPERAGEPCRPYVSCIISLGSLAS